MQIFPSRCTVHFMLSQNEICTDGNSADYQAVNGKNGIFFLPYHIQHDFNAHVPDNSCYKRSGKIIHPFRRADRGPGGDRKSCNTSEPKMAGMDIIKEYLTANFRSKPLNRHAVIVVPEREIPGSVAKPWQIPIINALV